MHKTEDTAYYLQRGWNVVAVDADLRMIEQARAAHAEAVSAERLRLVHCAVAASEGEMEFHLSQHSHWNSLKREVSNRQQRHHETVKVRTRRLSSLMREHGVPYYCKIDVEGYDSVCLQTLTDAPGLPTFVSVETECIGEGQQLTDSQALETLDQLQQLGYRRFKLVDQQSLAVLSPAAPNIHKRRTMLSRWVRRWLHASAMGGDFLLFANQNRRRLCQIHAYDFPEGCTGPFGQELEGEWLAYRQAHDELLRRRRHYFRMRKCHSFGFWCDWHATF
jgi:FkbM family methyltransferase